MKQLIGFLILTFALLVGSVPATSAAAQKKTQKTTQTTSSKRSTSSASKSSKAKSTKSTSTKSTKSKKSTKSTKSTKSASSSSSTPRTEADVKKAKQRNANEIKETQRKIQLNTRETEQRLNQLNLLEGEISDCNRSIDKITATSDSLNRAITATSDSITALDNRLAAITDKYVKALRKTQGQKQQTSALAFVFSSESFAQAYRRVRSLHQFSKWRKRRAGEISDMRAQLNERRDALATLHQQASDAAIKLSGERATLIKKQGETNSLVSRLKHEGGELKEIMSRRQKEAASLDAELDRIIAAEAARQEKLRREKEEADRKARVEAERKAREEADRKAREEEARQAAEAERQAQTQADEKAAKEKSKKELDEAKKAEKERAKAEKEAKKKADEAEKAAARDKTRTGKPVKHQGKNNGRGDTEGSTAATTPTTAPAASPTKTAPSAAAPTLKAPAASGSSGVAPKVDTPVGDDFGSYRGKLPFPVSGRYTIVKRFGRQKHPTLPHIETTNSGIDMQTAPGATVLAVFDGEVSAVFRPDGYNNVIVIRHGQYMTVYANLGSITVSTGQKVKAGQNLGTVYTDANDGNRSVLHFEIRNRREKEDPELWLKR